MNKLVILVCISDIECFGKSVTEVVTRTGLQCLSIMHQCLDRICCLCSCKLLFLSFLTLNHRDRQLILEEICIYIQHLQRLQTTMCHPCYLRCESLNMILFLLEQALRDEQRHIYVLYTGLFKTAVKLLVDVLPDCVTCRFDDHAAFDRRIVNQLCFLNNIGVPLCKIFLHRGDLLY